MSALSNQKLTRSSRRWIALFTFSLFVTLVVRDNGVHAQPPYTVDLWSKQPGQWNTSAIPSQYFVVHENPSSDSFVVIYGVNRLVEAYRKRDGELLWASADPVICGCSKALKPMDSEDKSLSTLKLPSTVSTLIPRGNVFFCVNATAVNFLHLTASSPPSVVAAIPIASTTIIYYTVVDGDMVFVTDDGVLRANLQSGSIAFHTYFYNLNPMAIPVAQSVHRFQGVVVVSPLYPLGICAFSVLDGSLAWTITLDGNATGLSIPYFSSIVIETAAAESNATQNTSNAASLLLFQGGNSPTSNSWLWIFANPGPLSALNQSKPQMMHIHVGLTTSLQLVALDAQAMSSGLGAPSNNAYFVYSGYSQNFGMGYCSMSFAVGPLAPGVSPLTVVTSFDGSAVPFVAVILGRYLVSGGSQYNWQFGDVPAVSLTDACNYENTVVTAFGSFLSYHYQSSTGVLSIVGTRSLAYVSLGEVSVLEQLPWLGNSGTPTGITFAAPIDDGFEYFLVSISSSVPSSLLTFSLVLVDSSHQNRELITFSAGNPIQAIVDCNHIDVMYIVALESPSTPSVSVSAYNTSKFTSAGTLWETTLLTWDEIYGWDARIYRFVQTANFLYWVYEGDIFVVRKSDGHFFGLQQAYCEGNTVFGAFKGMKVFGPPSKDTVIFFAESYGCVFLMTGANEPIGYFALPASPSAADKQLITAVGAVDYATTVSPPTANWNHVFLVADAISGAFLAAQGVFTGDVVAGAYGLWSTPVASSTAEFVTSVFDFLVYGNIILTIEAVPPSNVKAPGQDVPLHCHLSAYNLQTGAAYWSVPLRRWDDGDQWQPSLFTSCELHPAAAGDILIAVCAKYIHTIGLTPTAGTVLNSMQLTGTVSYGYFQGPDPLSEPKSHLAEGEYLIWPEYYGDENYGDFYASLNGAALSPNGTLNRIWQTPGSAYWDPDRATNLRYSVSGNLLFFQSFKTAICEVLDIVTGIRVAKVNIPKSSEVAPFVALIGSASYNQTSGRMEEYPVTGLIFGVDDDDDDNTLQVVQSGDPNFLPFNKSFQRPTTLPQPNFPSITQSPTAMPSFSPTTAAPAVPLPVPSITPNTYIAEFVTYLRSGGAGEPQSNSVVCGTYVFTTNQGLSQINAYSIVETNDQQWYQVSTAIVDGSLSQATLLCANDDKALIMLAGGYVLGWEARTTDLLWNVTNAAYNVAAPALPAVSKLWATKSTSSVVFVSVVSPNSTIPPMMGRVDLVTNQVVWQLNQTVTSSGIPVNSTFVGADYLPESDTILLFGTSLVWPNATGCAHPGLAQCDYFNTIIAIDVLTGNVKWVSADSLVKDEAPTSHCVDNASGEMVWMLTTNRSATGKTTPAGPNSSFYGFTPSSGLAQRYVRVPALATDQVQCLKGMLVVMPQAGQQSTMPLKARVWQVGPNPVCTNSDCPRTVIPSPLQQVVLPPNSNQEWVVSFFYAFPRSINGLEASIDLCFGTPTSVTLLRLNTSVTATPLQLLWTWSPTRSLTGAVPIAVGSQGDKTVIFAQTSQQPALVIVATDSGVQLTSGQTALALGCGECIPSAGTGFNIRVKQTVYGIYVYTDWGATLLNYFKGAQFGTGQKTRFCHNQTVYPNSFFSFGSEGLAVRYDVNATTFAVNSTTIAWSTQIFSTGAEQLASAQLNLRSQCFLPHRGVLYIINLPNLFVLNASSGNILQTVVLSNVSSGCGNDAFAGEYIIDAETSSILIMGSSCLYRVMWSPSSGGLIQDSFAYRSPNIVSLLLKPAIWRSGSSGSRGFVLIADIDGSFQALALAQHNASMSLSNKLIVADRDFPVVRMVLRGNALCATSFDHIRCFALAVDSVSGALNLSHYATFYAMYEPINGLEVGDGYILVSTATNVQAFPLQFNGTLNASFLLLELIGDVRAVNVVEDLGVFVVSANGNGGESSLICYNLTTGLQLWQVPDQLQCFNLDARYSTVGFFDCAQGVFGVDLVTGKTVHGSGIGQLVDGNTLVLTRPVGDTSGGDSSSFILLTVSNLAMYYTFYLENPALNPTTWPWAVPALSTPHVTVPAGFAPSSFVYPPPNPMFSATVSAFSGNVSSPVSFCTPIPNATCRIAQILWAGNGAFVVLKVITPVRVTVNNSQWYQIEAGVLSSESWTSAWIRNRSSCSLGGVLDEANAQLLCLHRVSSSSLQVTSFRLVDGVVLWTSLLNTAAYDQCWNSSMPFPAPPPPTPLLQILSHTHSLVGILIAGNGIVALGANGHQQWNWTSCSLPSFLQVMAPAAAQSVAPTFAQVIPAANIFLIQAVPVQQPTATPLTLALSTSSGVQLWNQSFPWPIVAVQNSSVGLTFSATSPFAPFSVDMVSGRVLCNFSVYGTNPAEATAPAPAFGYHLSSLNETYFLLTNVTEPHSSSLVYAVNGGTCRTLWAAPAVIGGGVLLTTPFARLPLSITSVSDAVVAFTEAPLGVSLSVQLISLSNGVALSSPAQCPAHMESLSGVTLIGCVVEEAGDPLHSGSQYRCNFAATTSNPARQVLAIELILTALANGSIAVSCPNVFPLPSNTDRVFLPTDDWSSFWLVGTGRTIQRYTVSTQRPVVQYEVVANNGVPLPARPNADGSPGQLSYILSGNGVSFVNWSSAFRQSTSLVDQSALSISSHSVGGEFAGPFSASSSGTNMLSRGPYAIIGASLRPQYQGAFLTPPEQYIVASTTQNVTQVLELTGYCSSPDIIISNWWESGEHQLLDVSPADVSWLRLIAFRSASSCIYAINLTQYFSANAMESANAVKAVPVFPPSPSQYTLPQKLIAVFFASWANQLALVTPTTLLLLDADTLETTRSVPLPYLDNQNRDLGAPRTALLPGIGYALWWNSMLLAYTTSGRLLWAVDVGPILSSYYARSGKTLLFAVPGVVVLQRAMTKEPRTHPHVFNPAELVAFNSTSGTLLWRRQDSTYLVAIPPPPNQIGTLPVIQGPQRTLWGINLITGAVQWSGAYSGCDVLNVGCIEPASILRSGTVPVALGAVSCASGTLLIVLDLKSGAAISQVPLRGVIPKSAWFTPDGAVLSASSSMYYAIPFPNSTVPPLPAPQPTSPPATTSPSSVTGSPQFSPAPASGVIRAKPLTTAAAVGIAVGCTVGVVVIVAGFVLLRKRRGGTTAEREPLASSRSMGVIEPRSLHLNEEPLISAAADV